MNDRAARNCFHEFKGFRCSLSGACLHEERLSGREAPSGRVVNRVNRNGMPALCGGVIRSAEAPAKKRVLTGYQKLGSAPCHFQPKEWK